MTAANGQTSTKLMRELWSFQKAAIFPFLLLFFSLVLLPFAMGVWISFHEWDLLGGPAREFRSFSGFENYDRLLHDPYFWSTLLNTVLFTICTVLTTTVVSLFLAIALNRNTYTAAILRGIFFLSSIFSVSVVTLIWLALLSPSRGLLGEVQGLLGFPLVDPLADSASAMVILIVVTTWWSTGMPMALFLAGLQQIPGELYEAADLDGANSWRKFFHITLPSLRHTTWLVILMGVVSHFQVFGQVYLMTGGGPANSTKVLVQYLFETSFRDWELGYASAMSVVLFTIIGLVALVRESFERKWGAAK